MTPRQIAILKNASRGKGYVDYEDNESMNDLLEQGYLVDIGQEVCEITAEGREALRNSREW